MSDYTPSLHRLALLARKHPTLMAKLLADYQDQEGLDDTGLARFLTTTVDMLPRLALCRRPRAGNDFREDVQQIAAYTHTDPLQLARLVRAVEAREDRYQIQSPRSHLLAAARDRDDEEPPETTNGDVDDDQ